MGNSDTFAGTLDPKKIEEWKREGPGLVSDPMTTWTETIAPLLADREGMLALLREVQWSARDAWGDAVCPTCEAEEMFHRHEPNCRLAALLK